MIVNIVERFPRNVTIGYHDSVHTRNARGFADVHNIFAPNRGLVVGKGNRGTAISQGQRGNVLWRDVRGIYLIVMGFGNVPILAEKAAHVAAGCAERKNSRAGQKMVEGLFLNGINLQRSRLSIAQAVKFPAAVHANVAKSGLPFADVAMPWTKVTVDAAVVVSLPPTRFMKRLDGWFRRGKNG
jgi:hypothetical protein